MVVFENVTKRDLLKLLKKGFVQEAVKTVYEDLRLIKDGVVLVLYTSGKLLLQGKEAQLEDVKKLLHTLKIGQEVKSDSFRREAGWIIGSDETLKGDTFGGLVVAAVKANDLIREELISIGVADSKTLSDKEIILIAEKIRTIASCDVRSLLPYDYNHSKQKITELLNSLHREAAASLLPGKHIVDKYPGCTVGDVILEKAESKYAEVAAASIIARAAALKQIDYLSVQAGFRVPLGSTHVQLALHELQDRQRDFTQFVKLDFKNVQEFLKHQAR